MWVGKDVAHLHDYDADPLDIVAAVDGHEVALELVELRRLALGALWSEEELIAHINLLLDKKAAHYTGWTADALGLHIDEYWIAARATIGGDRLA